jgi:5-formyltetrahydrofolate cyclo-ligase
MPTVEAASSHLSEEPAARQAALEDMKAVLRRSARQRRGVLAPAVRAAAAETVVAALAESPLLPAATGIVAGYWPVGGELDCRPLLNWFDAAGWGCALPVVAGAAGSLRFRRWQPGAPLAAGAWGIPEPVVSAPEVRPTVVLVPLLAFDRAGHRLGQGGGHYDRTLALLRARASVLAVGLAFALQEEPALPAAPHDQPLDWVVTEVGALRVGPA